MPWVVNVCPQTSMPIAISLPANQLVAPVGVGGLFAEQLSLQVLISRAFGLSEFTS